MGMSRSRRIRTAWLLLALVIGAAAVDGARVWQDHRWNQLIASGRVPTGTNDVPARAQFAQAHALAASGAGDAALQRYRAVQGLQADSTLSQAASYNSANLLMRQAVVVRAGAQPGNAVALIELAKEMYRDVLRADPQHWDARYNLERAQRLLADPDEQSDGQPPDLRREAERSSSSSRGTAPGLP